MSIWQLCANLLIPNCLRSNHSCSPLAALELYVNKTTITAIKLLILRSFQRKGLCNSGRLKALPLHTIISNNTFKVTICDLKNKDRNMADNIEHQDKGEQVTNCDLLQNDEVVVTTPVESRIMSIRGKQIMIDRDLAELYGVETKRLNEAVKRNIERFPERFRFQLTKEEMAELVANCDQFNSLKHSTVRSYAFTEQGVAMLSTVLRSKTAIRVSIRIMDAFVAMRRFMVTNAEVFQRLSTMDNYVDETVLTLLDKRDNNVSAIIYTQQISPSVPTRH